MRASMSSDSRGEYKDLGPRKNTTLDGVFQTEPAHVRAAIRQGKQRPRPLSLEETERAELNRTRSRGNSGTLEHWYRTQAQQFGTIGSWYHIRASRDGSDEGDL